jgi:Short C-terminal domain
MSLLRTAGRAAVAGAVIGRVQRRQQGRWAAADQAAAAPPAPTAPPSTGATPTAELLAQLERLGNLRDSGVLSDAEFAAQKARILG